MINALLVFNNSGQPRVTKFYHQLDTNLKQRIISEIYGLVAERSPSWCNFIPLPPSLKRSTSSEKETQSHMDPTTIVYRQYATLYFIIISTVSESPLALLDFIQVFVEVLDRLFESVCELDLIFNFETLHVVLDEMICGGIVIETDLDTIVDAVRAQGKIVKRRDVPDGFSLSDVVGAGLGGLGRGWK